MGALLLKVIREHPNSSEYPQRPSIQQGCSWRSLLHPLMPDLQQQEILESSLVAGMTGVLT